MELDLQSLFVLHVHSCTHWLRAAANTECASSAHIFFGTKRNAKRSHFPRLERKRILTAHPTHNLPRIWAHIRGRYTIGQPR